MVQVWLFILKLIGWIFLGILGLILGILLFVLFSAIRYQIEGKKDDKLEGRIHITWLLWIISAEINYQNGLQIQMKLFGKTMWKMNSKEKEPDDAKDPKEKQPGELPETEYGEAAKKPDAEWLKDEKADAEWLKGEKPKEEENTESKTKKKLWKKKKQRLGKDKEKPEETQQLNEAAEKQNLLEKLKGKIAALMEKLRFSFAKFCGKLKQIEEKRQQMQEKWNWLCRKWDNMQAMIQNPENQKSIRLIIRQIKKIIRHGLPRKGTASVTIGREDPYIMGKLLSYAAILYPFTHKFLAIHPVFGQNQLEGEVHIRGRIRLGVILGYALRLLLNKNIRRQLFALWRKKN